MAWTAPITFVAGAILTAAQMNVVMDNLLAGGPIYTTEAARDAAITAPFEGQTAYLTASTVTNATAAVYPAIPSGVRTIYNGSVWVCTTPVGGQAYSATVPTQAASGANVYSTTLSGGTADLTAITATLVTGTSALVTVSGVLQSTATFSGYITFSVSGATTRAAADVDAAWSTAPTAVYRLNLGRTAIVTGLTAGTNTFTLNYRGDNGTISWWSRALTVTGIA